MAPDLSRNVTDRCPIDLGVKVRIVIPSFFKILVFVSQCTYKDFGIQIKR